MIYQLFLLFGVIQGTHLGLGLGLPEDNPPTGLLTKTQPNPRVGFWWAGLGGGRVLARPTLDSSLSPSLCFSLLRLSLSAAEINLLLPVEAPFQ